MPSCRGRGQVVLVATLHVLAALCAADGDAPPHGSNFERRLRAKLEAAFLGPDGVLNRSVPAGGPHGGFWLAFQNGSEQFTVALGSSNGLDPAAAGGQAAAASDIIPAGSLAKPFTATAVMRLVEAGVVGLDDAIRGSRPPRGAPQLAPYPPQLAPPTLISRPLCSHRSVPQTAWGDERAGEVGHASRWCLLSVSLYGGILNNGVTCMLM